MTGLVKKHPSERVKAFWSAIGVWLNQDKRLGRLARLGGPRADVADGMDFQIERLGEDSRFAGTRLRAHAKALRDRPADVATPEHLIAHHPGYRNRVVMGTSWRTDAWTELELQPHLKAAELARAVGCSFGTAWQAKRDFELYGRRSA